MRLALAPAEHDMNRGTGFATGAAALARRKEKARRKKPLVAKAVGRSAVDKREHWRSEEHLKLVRAQPCLVSRVFVDVVAHHPDECFPRLVAAQRKISDYLCVPICHHLHDPGHPGALHKVNHPRWWAERGVDVYAFLRAFLRRHYKPGHPGADLALEMIAEAAGGGIVPRHT